MRTMLTACALACLIGGHAAAAEMRIARDIAYATHADDARLTSVDVYAPASGSAHPVMLWIHGGGWRIGDKRSVQEKPQAFVDNGFVLVSVNYRLYPDADYRQQAADVAQAIRWAHVNIAAHGGDSQRLFLMGHSAGAHLAALVATDERYLKAEKLNLTDLRGVVLLDGAGYDIPKQIRWSIGPARQLYTSVFGEDEKAQRDASPITHVAPRKGIPPFLIAHVADRVASTKQARLLANKLRTAGGNAAVFAAADKSHATINREFGTVGDAPTTQTFLFLDEILDNDKAPTPAPPTDRLVSASVTVDGLARRYQLYVPPSPRARIPLVFVLHGGGGDSQKIIRYTNFHELARTQGFAVCYPYALIENWNDGRQVGHIPEHRDKIDDVAFIRLLIDELAEQYAIDRGRVFATGASNGGIMSHRLAAEAADVIAGIAPVIGGMAVPIAADFNPSHPVSLFVIQGDADPLVPIDGGAIGFRLGRKRGSVLSTKEVVARYLKRNQISGAPARSMLEDLDPSDGTTTESTIYPAGLAGARVQVYLVRNGGHTWPGKPGYAAELLIGKASQDFDATHAIWEFFKLCPPRNHDF